MGFFFFFLILPKEQSTALLCPLGLHTGTGEAHPVLSVQRSDNPKQEFMRFLLVPWFLGLDK